MAKFTGITTSVPQEFVEWYLSLKSSPTYQVGLLGWALLLGLDTYQSLVIIKARTLLP